MTTTKFSRRNRATGTTITVRNDDFLGWVTICEYHGQFAEHPTRATAESWMVEPFVWCSGCQSIREEMTK